jgi:hypothetical protein
MRMIKMKFISVLVMALLLVVGIGSAQNHMPEFTMEPGANLSYYDGGNNLQTFDFSDEPADGDFFMSIGDIWSLVKTKFFSDVAVVGPASDTWSIFYDETTDGIDDAVEIELALADNKAVKLVNGPFYISNNSIDIDEAQRRLYSDGSEVELISDSGATNPIINLTASQCTIERLLLNGNKSELVEGQYGISWTSGNQNYIHHCRIANTGSDAIHIEAPDYSLGGGAIHNNYIYNPYRYGLYLSGNDLMFCDNSIGWTNDIPVFLADAHNNLFSRNHVWVNFSSDAVDSAMFRVDGTQNVFDANDIDGITKWVFTLDGGSDYTQIVNNKFWNVIYDGGYAMLIDATADTTTHLTVTGNMLRKVANDTYALNVDASHHHTIVGNNFDGVASWGMSGNNVYANDMIVGS